MIEVATYQGRLVAIFGLGRTGLSAARALRAGGAHVVLGDGNEAALKAAAEQGFETAELNETVLTGASALVLSPGVPFTHPKPHEVVVLAKDQGCPVIGDTELFAQVMCAGDANKSRLTGITGTNGKSTTTALIGHCIQGSAVGGNIGEAVLNLPASADHYVIELSSYQIDLTQTLACDTAILLNLAPDHLDRHGNFAGYQAAKKRLFAMQRDGANAVIGVDDPDSAGICAGLAAEGRLNVVPISINGALSHGVFIEDGTLFDAMDGAAVAVLNMADAPAMPGAHNGQNAAAAYAACKLAGMEREAIAARIKSFPGLAHRIETIGCIDGVRFVNDSKATNAEAAAKALAAFTNIYWIAGGKPKEGGLAPLYEGLGNVTQAYLIGEAAAQFAQELAGKVPTQISNTIEQATAKALVDAKQTGGVVLLSPAAASFDQFKDFEARGEAFRAAVQALHHGGEAS
ncbi:MAG: UDP-N-acetylmuramoyl-L-alanine--D-glutamate ligase [Alphaproteobacteria bacterium]